MKNRLLGLTFLTLAGCGGPNLGSTPPGPAACADGSSPPAVEICDGQPQCADGSDEVGCEASVRLRSLEVTRLSLEGDTPDGRVEVHHPIRVDLTLRADVASSGPFTVAFGFVEAGARPGADVVRCVFGGETLLLTPEMPEHRLSMQAKVPARCLPEGVSAVDHALWVRLDAMRRATTLDGAPVTRTLVFDRARRAVNESCVDAAGRRGCVAEIRLEPSRGPEVEIAALELGSSVAMLRPEVPLTPTGKPQREIPPLVTVNGTFELSGADPEAEDPLAGLERAPTLSFAMRPAGAPDAHWRPLATTPANAAADGARPRPATLEGLAADGPTTLPFGLHPSPELEDRLRTGGVWAADELFELQVCLRGTGATEDRCEVREILIARPSSRRSVYSTGASRFGTGWSDRWGSTSTEQLRAGLDFYGRASAAGVSVDDHLYAELRGWIDYDIFDARWAARAAGMRVGSFYDAELTVFDDVLRDSYALSRGDNLTADTDQWTDRSWTDRECESWSYDYLVSIDLRGCATGRIGLDLDGDYEVRQSVRGLDGSREVTGSIGVSFRPFANAELSVTASVDAGAARAGVSADVDILGAELTRWRSSGSGARTRMHMDFRRSGYGDSFRNSYLADLDANLTLETLSGRIWVYVDYLDAWESFWGWERRWVRWGDRTIATWPGLDASFDVVHDYHTGVRSVYSSSEYSLALSRL